MFDPDSVAMTIVSGGGKDKSDEKQDQPGKMALIAMMEAARSGDYDTAWEAFEAAVAACAAQDSSLEEDY